MKVLLTMVSMLALCLAAIAHADRAHHTVRLDWIDVDQGDASPALRAGHATDVHTEGDPKASIQYFFVNGARPHATYEVVYVVDGLAWVPDTICQGNLEFPVHFELYLETDRRGIGRARWQFTQAELEGSGVVETYFGLRFQLWDTETGTLAYDTPCFVAINDL